MTLREMIPGLNAEELKTIRINATRMNTSGTPKQKEQARDALVLLDEEEARRREAAPPPAPKASSKAKSADPSKKPRKAKAPAAAS
ncbi:hypothetical protein [Mongoliimonas terrestris]|uniref:hypothetical protein n=1 Tax=Mongoliimonas terrestris TaxID=1709001 RepID=UPI000949AA61|nr:hypothetical protein [Mongoliimonas terrestris]